MKKGRIDLENGGIVEIDFSQKKLQTPLLTLKSWQTAVTTTV